MIQDAEYDRFGFLLDRRWLVIKTKDLRFMTARETSKMLLIETAIQGSELVIRIPNDPPEEYTVPLWPDEDELEDFELVNDVVIWGHKVDGYAVSSEVDQALSQFLGKSVRLVRKGPRHRPTGSDPTFGPLEYDESQRGANFQDVYPMQVVSEASLEGTRQSIRDAVATKADIDHLDHSAWTEERIETINIERWRPNIVISGPLRPFEEDSWEGVEIGPDRNLIYTVARCARCLVPNLNTANGVRDEAVPWSVMQLSRIMHPEIFAKYCFGMQSVPAADKGKISVGDVVRVVKTCDPSKRVMAM